LLSVELEQEIKKAYLKMYKFFSKEAKRDFVRYAYPYDAQMASWIRIKLLGENSRLCQEFIKDGIEDKVQMSHLILVGFYQYLQKKKEFRSVRRTLESR